MAVRIVFLFLICVKNFVFDTKGGFCPEVENFMKTSLKTIRLVCQFLDDPQHSFRAIAKICKISHNTVSRIAMLKNDAKLNNTKTLGDDVLSNVFFKQSISDSNGFADWGTVHTEMQQRDITLHLLWQELREQNAYVLSYSQFCKKYSRWRRTSKLSMRQTHKPGEYLFIDFCGRTMSIRDKITLAEQKVQVFVGVLGSSAYIFAKAIASQKTNDFLDVHVKMFEHLKGVTKYIVPDNLKSAVIKNTRELTQLNEAYCELSEHYNFIILPARPRTPKDKSMAEVSVQIVQRFVLARLRHRTFFSVDELNREIDYWMTILNERVTRTYTTSRSERLETIDRAFLTPLPETPYEYSDWKFGARVDETYHVFFQGKHYSVPYVYAHQMVDVRSTNDRMDVYYQRQRIATHQLGQSELVISKPEHYPPDHRYAKGATPEAILSWAEQVGVATKQFIETNFTDKRYFASRLKAANKLRKDVFENKWDSELENACQYAIRINGMTFQTLYSILKHQQYNKVPPSQITPTVITHENLRGARYYANPMTTMTQVGE